MYRLLVLPGVTVFCDLYTTTELRHVTLHTWSLFCSCPFSVLPSSPRPHLAFSPHVSFSSSLGQSLPLSLVSVTWTLEELWSLISECPSLGSVLFCPGWRAQSDALPGLPSPAGWHRHQLQGTLLWSLGLGGVDHVFPAGKLLFFPSVADHCLGGGGLRPSRACGSRRLSPHPSVSAGASCRQ